MTAYWTEAVTACLGRRCIFGSVLAPVLPPQPSFLPGAALSLPTPAQLSVWSRCKVDCCSWSKKLEPCLENGSEWQGRRGWQTGMGNLLYAEASVSLKGRLARRLESSAGEGGTRAWSTWISAGLSRGSHSQRTEQLEFLWSRRVPLFLNRMKRDSWSCLLWLHARISTYLPK